MPQKQGLVGSSVFALPQSYPVQLGHYFVFQKTPDQLDGMESYIFRPELFADEYNCSFYETDAVPYEARQHTTLGVLFLGSFVIFEVSAANDSRTGHFLPRTKPKTKH